MVNYQNSIIYKLCCKNIEVTDIYIGSTTAFKARKRQHKCVCNNENDKSYNSKIYKFIRENGNFQNWDMIQIKTVSCNSKRELEAEERLCIEELKPSLNRQIPTRTKKEWNNDNADKVKQYYVDNKEHIKEYNKQYKIDNADKIKEKIKEYNINNADKIQEYQKKYNIDNIEKKKVYNKEQYQKNYEKNKDKINARRRELYRLKKQQQQQQQE